MPASFSVTANSDKIVLNEDMETIIAGKPFSDIRALAGKLSDRPARKWYLAQDVAIVHKVRRNQGIESQARQAFELRNQNRIYARDLMRDQKNRRELDMTDPNKSFDELVSHKMLDN